MFILALLGCDVCAGINGVGVHLFSVEIIDSSVLVVKKTLRVVFIASQNDVVVGQKL